MFVRDDVVFTSASDLTAAVTCEWALMRRLDAKLGRIEAVPEPVDAMLERASVLGGEHEQRELGRFRESFGPYTPGTSGGVAEIAEPASKGDLDALREAMAATLEALRDGAEVVYQATFVDEGFVGFADFLVRTGDEGGLPRFAVYDTKLARKAKITAMMQLAAYAGQLRRIGIPVDDEVHLILGDGTLTTHRLDEVEPVFLDRMARLRAMIDARVADTAPIAWGADGYVACGRCAECTVQVEATRDVLLVAGLRAGQRAHLAAAGVRTIDELAARADLVPGIGPATFEKLRDQARMQLEAPPHEPGERARVAYHVYDSMGLAALPAPDEGDIFFDFEGDPLWSDEHGRDWGLDYLFGVVEHEPNEPEHFRAFWAHDRAGEKQALLDFLDYVQRRRARHPGLHIYHYADYERAHLQLLCSRYGVGEAILDELLREHVFVDLYPVVKRSIRISERSYSLKKLEPLYMGDELRESDVTNAADSITAYVDYTLLVDAGRADEAAAQLAQIEEYNRYDCVSTHRLRNWLIERADERGVARRSDVLPDVPRNERLERDEDAARNRLLRSVEGVPAADRDADQTALALAAAAIEYHRREDKTFWWEHYNRQVAPIEEWADQRDVFVVDLVRIVSDWSVDEGRRQPTRTLVLRGRLSPGSRLDIGSNPFAMYEQPLPARCNPVPPGQRGEHAGIRVIEVIVEGERTDVLIEEGAGIEGETWRSLPLALTPAAPIATKNQRAAILEWGQSIGDDLPAMRAEPSLDLLRRIPPRLTGGGALPEPTDAESWRPIALATSRLDRSYLAVQGPPGSGKTYVGAKVIAELVREHRWRIGVVAQSHEVVENLLRRIVAEGVPADLVGKRPPRSGYQTTPPWTVLDEPKQMVPFQLDRRTSGFVLGGTAWNFANASQVPRNGLDLLVVDEAGQFSLANTIAVGGSARNLLLLGDPQQLPQVSQGLHPEPIDTSALGWLSSGHDVLPAEYGYFLAQSWRMHPTLCAAVSDLSYEGRLSPRLPETLERRLDGAAPGLHPIRIEHSGNATESPEEAAAVVDLVRAHVGREWTDPTTGRVADPLRPSDIIVVAPYNAQVGLLRTRLDEAGFTGTPVGTVDKFQGQEAAVAIVSLTASSATDVPRGISFLLLRNRLNVAISRAKWAAYLVHSPALRDYLPYTAEGVAELSGFLRLTGAVPRSQAAHSAILTG
ncbi:bifunctional RecB family nuclease/DEAD/DEAH box helicase [Herbiconiux sp. L3-i23]|uniref:TM0106 family RecB-like putative nuclease n=1 Tax=Herbiconiux sp. L3-i23 TaxID=2905871 RepID=UPI00205A46F8|nr:bifunctional RecB family nuclease/DEAD/DEAH box helicase [Herbiconiux sp. L3-i23]BDI22475.1 ATPase [Herbiconiux sp. L3-i23]